MSRLEHARSVVEDRFLEAGRVLGGAVDGLGRLTASLNALAGTLDLETVQATGAELNAAAQGLLELPVRSRQRNAMIGRLSVVGDGLTAAIEDMRRDLAYLRVFAINIKVTAAGIEGAGADFAHFAQEISDTIEAGRRELEAFAGEVATLRAELGQALAQESGLEGQCIVLIPPVSEELQGVAEQMAAHHRKIAEVTAEVAGIARSVQRQVGSALAALQVGDSTRQRIEHVQYGLTCLDRTDFEPARRAAASTAVHGLLARQLAAAAADFRRDAEQIRQSMAHMADGGAEILRLRDLAFGRSASGEGFLERMKDHLAQALGLVDRMEAADVAAAATGESAARTAGALHQRIATLQRIKTDVQQMALNTTLKCSRIGELGKPLAVIAVELRSHAGNLEDAAKHTLGGLAELSQGAQGLTARPRDIHARASLAGAVERVADASGSVETDLSDLARQGEAVVLALDKAAARLDFEREIGAALDAAAAALDRDDPTSLLTEDFPAGLVELLGAIARTYTMAQERKVHAAFAASLGLVEDSAKAVA